MLKSSWKMSWKYFSYFKLTREWHNPCSSVSQGSVGIYQTFLFQPEYHSVIIIIICCSDHESWPDARPLGAGHPSHPRHHWGLQFPPAARGQKYLREKQASCKNGWLCKKDGSFEDNWYCDVYCFLSCHLNCSQFAMLLCIVVSTLLAYLNFPLFCFSFLLSVSHLKISRFA